MDFWPKNYLILYPSCGNATTPTTILNVPTEIRPHAGDVEFWLIPLSNVKATINVSRMSLKLLRSQPHIVENLGITMAPLFLSLTS